jgi:hypothetical protein
MMGHLGKALSQCTMPLPIQNLTGPIQYVAKNPAGG